MGKGVRLPPYARHASGQAKVRIAGKDFYCGRHGTPGSRERYDRLVSEWLAQGMPRPWSGPCRAGKLANGCDPVVVELVQRYLKFADDYYRKDGRATSELLAVRAAARFVQRLYSRLPVNEFGPGALKTCRELMVRRDLARKTVNSYVGRVRRMFRWGTENELITGGMYQGLECVSGLLRGRTAARETEPIHPVDRARIDAVLPVVSRQVRAMIDLQFLTGMRPGEVVQMRAGDLVVSGEVWRYRPAAHKTQHHGKSRVVAIGPKAQVIVKSFMRADLARPLFSPNDAEAERLARARAEARHPRSAKQTVPAEQRCADLRDSYSVATYRRAISRACVEAKVTPWHPN